MNMPKSDPEQLKRINLMLENSKHPVLISHTNADGDAVGSLLGCLHLIERHMPGREVSAILPQGCPRIFRHLPGSGRILNGETQQELCEKRLREADLILAVDLNNAPRVDMLASALVESPARKILIDHHHEPDRELFHEVVSVSELSSACELVYWTFSRMWGRDCLTREAAICLYNGLCTDTGSFSFSNDAPSLYEAAAELVRMDIEPADIHNHIDNTFSIEKMQFWGHAISHLLHIERESRFAYFLIPLADIQRFGITSEDLEGLVNYTLKMEEIEVGALVREEADRVKVSFRSKYGVDVSVIAREHFNGGGHTKASGATITGLTLQEVEQKLRNLFVK